MAAVKRTESVLEVRSVADMDLTSGGSGGSSGTAAAGAFVDGGEVLIGKLVSTLLGAVWLTVVGGWYAITSAITRVQIALINSVRNAQVAIIRAVGAGGAETIRVGWASAAQAAVETSPLFAPLLLTMEIILVSAVALTVRRRLL